MRVLTYKSFAFLICLPFVTVVGGCSHNDGPADTPTTLQGKIKAIEADPSLDAGQKDKRKAMAEKMAADYQRARAMKVPVTNQPNGVPNTQ